MMSPDLGRSPAIPVEFSRRNHGIDGDLGPMPQQDSDVYHGYAMRPQKFIRLVGCHTSSAATHEVDRSSDAQSQAA